MQTIGLRKIFIIVVGLSGVIINAAYGTSLLRAFFAPQYNSAIREILISAIVMEFGWAALLAWVVFKPFERRHILLFTLVPVLLGNVLHSVSQFMESHGSAGAMALNTTIGLLYSGLYVVAFLVGKPNRLG
jgi:hypothetical protein